MPPVHWNIHIEVLDHGLDCAQVDQAVIRSGCQGLRSEYVYEDVDQLIKPIEY